MPPLLTHVNTSKNKEQMYLSFIYFSFSSEYLVKTLSCYLSAFYWFYTYLAQLFFFYFDKAMWPFKH